MKYLIKLLSIALAVFVAAELLPGVSVEGFKWAFLVALTLSLLNIFVKPVLIFMTIPATIVTLGLFLFVINALIILLADYFIESGFEVSGFWYALLFSIVLSLFTSVIERITGQKKPKLEESH
ncbi:MAG: phage holin family protein [Flavobacteriales bacterium]